MSKVKLEVLKPWITQKIVEIIGIEDDVVIGFIFSQVGVNLEAVASFPLR
jgi:serine/arginine repetitive matrix protein 1